MANRNRPYFTLVEWFGPGSGPDSAHPAGFQPQFGDYSRAVVAEERDDYLRYAEDNDSNGYTAAELRRHFRIVRTANDTQPAIDAAIAALTAKTWREGLYGQRKGGK